MNIYKLIEELNWTVKGTKRNPNKGYHLNYNEALHAIIKETSKTFWRGFWVGIGISVSLVVLSYVL